MINIENKADCCGCTACVSICPHYAITMQADGLGFLYPIVDESKCVECGLCDNVCAFNDHYTKNHLLDSSDIYAVRHKNIKEIENSRSGAMFVAISDWILDNGGIVYGVGYAEYFYVLHKCASTKKERNEFRGSKYVQSDLNTIFVEIKDDLKHGFTVLFSGTPCQTSGLLSYLSILRVDMDRLYVIDIVCHGVPSPYIWRDYLSYIEQKHRMKIINVNFRDKTKWGWSSHEESFTLENNITYPYTAYTYMYYKHIMLRYSCANCHFSNFQRPSDITIADFWGWERVDKSFNSDDKGVSLVLVNSLKGRSLFSEVKQTINYVKTDIANSVQPNLRHPTTNHLERETFENDYIKNGFLYVMKKYGKMGWRYKSKSIIRGILRTVKNIIIK